jgi:hypothetical protein
MLIRQQRDYSWKIAGRGGINFHGKDWKR